MSFTALHQRKITSKQFQGREHTLAFEKSKILDPLPLFCSQRKLEVKTKVIFEAGIFKKSPHIAFTRIQFLNENLAHLLK